MFRFSADFFLFLFIQNEREKFNMLKFAYILKEKTFSVTQRTFINNSCLQMFECLKTGVIYKL